MLAHARPVPRGVEPEERGGGVEQMRGCKTAGPPTPFLGEINPWRRVPGGWVGSTMELLSF